MCNVQSGVNKIQQQLWQSVWHNHSWEGASQVSNLDKNWEKTFQKFYARSIFLAIFHISYTTERRHDLYYWQCFFWDNTKENAPQISCSGPRAQSVKDAVLSQPRFSTNINLPYFFHKTKANVNKAYLYLWRITEQSSCVFTFRFLLLPRHRFMSG